MLKNTLSGSQGISLSWWGCYFLQSFIVFDALTLSLLTDSSQVPTYQHEFQNQQGTYCQYKSVGVHGKLESMKKCTIMHLAPFLVLVEKYCSETVCDMGVCVCE